MNANKTLVAVALALAVAGRGFAQEPAPPADGPSLYKTYCASCHGVGGKGDGPMADFLRTVPPDLTQLAERNKGIFDRERVARIVDGRQAVMGHGGPDMPVWGDAFKLKNEGYSEAKVKERISLIVRHLESLQERKAKASHAVPEAAALP